MIWRDLGCFLSIRPPNSNDSDKGHRFEKSAHFSSFGLRFAYEGLATRSAIPARSLGQNRRMDTEIWGRRGLLCGLVRRGRDAPFSLKRAPRDRLAEEGKSPLD